MKKGRILILLLLTAALTAGVSLALDSQHEPQPAVSAPLYPTSTSTSTSTTSSVSKPLTTQTQPRATKKLLNVPYISQKGAYPTGCESCSAVMLLQYLGLDISVNTFVDEHLICGGLWWQDGQLYGDDPNQCFIGSPYDINSYGCFAPVIASAYKSILPSETYTVSTLYGKTLAELCDTYVSQGMPVLTWVTINMLPSYGGSTWTLRDGSVFQWPAQEHCMVLVGYDENGFYFNDPYNSNGLVYYSRALAEQRYAEIGSQAVVVVKK
jgi:uncharacterized protein YvpB